MSTRPCRLALAGALAWSVVVAAPGDAAEPGERIVARDDGYAIRAAPGQANHLVLEVSEGGLLIADEAVDAFSGVPQACTSVAVPQGAAVSCPLVGSVLVRALLDDGDDYLEGDQLPATVALRVDTGTGSDVVLGGDGDDRIAGHSEPDQADTLYGGYGDDWVAGGDGDDYLRGNDGHDVIKAGGGAFNLLIGDDGPDNMFGGPGVEYMSGGAGVDYLIGDGGPDNLHGDGDRDYLFGQAGADTLLGGGGPDRLRGGLDDDLLLARDGTADEVSCSDGRDEARVDQGLDLVSSSCEIVRGR